MALTEENKPAVGKVAVNSTQKTDKREKPLTKVIVRRLPPTIDKETFFNQISPVPSHDYFYLVNGEAALGENSFSRAYINFLNPNDVFDFKEKFDNYVFLDHKGNEYAAVVEFAAFQKTPKRRNKVRVDPKCGSIESDPFYLDFIENLNKPVELEDKPEYSYQFLNENRDSKESITTPLLEFVKNRRVERMRIREERREERKKKELERKKMRDEEKKKRFDEKSPTKVFVKNKTEDKDFSDGEVKDDKFEETKTSKYFDKSSTYRNKDKKFDDRKKDIKMKPSPRKEYQEKREFKSKKEYYKEPKYETFKKEEKQFPKKVKKYSEKREERRMEAQKMEIMKAEGQENKSQHSGEHTDEIKASEEDKIFNKDEKKGNERKDENIQSKLDKVNQEPSTKSGEKDEESKESTFSSEIKESRKERIRNKDRPTIAIYRPGMLSKRKLTEGDGDKEVKEK